MDQVVIKGWRRLVVRGWGPPNGSPVFLLHGTPGCRLSVRPHDTDLERLAVRLVAYDRPGYGLSDPHPGRTVADAADDVRAIADALGIESFAVMGRSGGAPHALACAALLPGRVSRVASLVGLAPHNAPDLDWLDGMVELNRQQYGAAMLGPRPLAEVIYPQVIAMRADPEHLARRLEREGSPADQEALRDPEYRATWVRSIQEAVGRSLDGWAADSLALTRPWGFDPGWIRVPTLLWHGTWDVFAPVTHARWLAGRIKGAVLSLCDDAGHLSAAEAQVHALRWLVDRDDSWPALACLDGNVSV
jgi:pimeloyl-ACP methyl ester carboxylesterase